MQRLRKLRERDAWRMEEKVSVRADPGRLGTPPGKMHKQFSRDFALLPLLVKSEAIPNIVRQLSHALAQTKNPPRAFSVGGLGGNDLTRLRVSYSHPPGPSFFRFNSIRLSAKSNRKRCASRSLRQDSAVSIEIMAAMAG